MTLGSLPPDHTPLPGGVVRGHAQQRQQLSVQHYAWIIAVTVIFALLLHLLGDILTPFLIGAILAYIGNPAVSWGEAHRVSRTMGTLLVVAVTGLAVFGLILVLTPLVHSEFAQLVRRLPDLAVLLQTKFAPWLQEKFGIELQLDMDSIKAMVADNLAGAQALTPKVLSSVRAGGTFILGRPDQHGADPGGDVLSAARLEHHPRRGSRS